MARTSRAWTLKARPTGIPAPEVFEVVTSPRPTVQTDGDVLVRIIYVTVDPYIRGRLDGVKTYIDGFQLGDVIGGESVGVVEQSKSSKFKVGTYVLGMGLWQEYHLVNVEQNPSALTVIPDGIPIQSTLGALGMPGNTALHGLYTLADPKAGETVVVTAAAGAVGLVVVQLAKARGARVVGIASSQEKLDLLKNEYGADEAITYLQDRESFAKALKAAAPNGVDVFFENVGGWIGVEVYKQLNVRARVTVCGVISQYNKADNDAFDFQKQVLVKSLTVRGFIIINDIPDQYQANIQTLVKLYKEGKLKIKETIGEGFENIPSIFTSLFTSGNVGKLLVRISEDPTQNL